MNIILAGGSGFIGSALGTALLGAGHHVTVLSRHPERVAASGGPAVERWDGSTTGPWTERLGAADAVINLSGTTLAGRRWSSHRKEVILASRILPTRALVAAMAAASRRPAVLINASAVGFYGPDPPGAIDENHEAGTGFLAETCIQWEKEALRARESGVRVVLLRTAVVLGEGGGALARMLLPFRLCVGGPIGSGRQWFPWIHRDDVIEATLFALSNARLAGPVNLVAPEPVTMREFSSTLGRVVRRPARMRVPAWLLRLALGEQAEMVLTGQRVIPAKLLSEGYRFRFTRLEDALQNIL